MKKLHRFLEKFSLTELRDLKMRQQAAGGQIWLIEDEIKRRQGRGEE